MNNKVVYKVVVVFGLLGAVLLFLAMQFVPNIFAGTPAKGANVDVAKLAGSDWVERHPASVANAAMYTGSDWIERHPSAAFSSVNYSGSDWIERHPGSYYAGSDWIERHPGR